MIHVDKSLCIGCQMCSITAPNSFKIVSTQTGEYKAEAIIPAGDNEEKINEAVANCPVQAIKI